MSLEEQEQPISEELGGRERARELFVHPAAAIFAALLFIQGLIFLVPGWRASEDVWPTPIDDSYIHAVYAKNLIRGYLFTWSIPDGYSKGETTAIYPLLLAPGWAIGFRDHWIMLWAALLNMVSAWLACCLLFDLVRQRTTWLFAALIGALPLMCGPVIWGVYSGMEIGVSLLGTCWVLWSFDHLWREPPTTSRIWIHVASGIWLVGMRPEGALIYGAITIFAILKRWKAIRWNILSLVFLPALPVLLYFLLNFIMTGDPQPNSAVIKSFWRIDWYESHLKWDIWWHQVDTLRLLFAQAWFGDHFMAGWRLLQVIALVSLAALFSREWRGLVLAGFSAAVIIYFFQAGQRDPAGGPVARYLAPWAPLLFVLTAAGGGMIESAIRNRLDATEKVRRSLAGTTLILPVGLAVVMIGGLIHCHRNFVKDTRRISKYQIAIAREMRRMADAEPDRTFRFLTHEGGAPIYFSDLPALDILGLCSQMGDYPLQTAHIEDAMAPFEALESAWPREDLPDWTVMFTSLWGVPPYSAEVIFDPEKQGNAPPSLTESLVLFRFPKELVGAGHPLPKQFEEPGWRVVDRLDVADRLSEREHDFSMPLAERTYDHGVLAVHDETGEQEVYDIGRGLRRPMTFQLGNLNPGKPLKIFVRIYVRGDNEMYITMAGETSKTVIQGEHETKLLLLHELESVPSEKLEVTLKMSGPPPPVLAHLWAVQPE